MTAHQGLSSWIWLSVGLAVVISNLAWVLCCKGLRVQAFARFAAWPGTPALSWFATAIYLLLPPVAAWRLSLLSPYYLGVTENDWIAALGAGGGLAVLITGISLGGWLVYRRSLRDIDWPDRSIASGTYEAPAERWVAPVSAALAQWHAAFYRAGAIAWVAGSTAPFAALTGFLAQTPLSGPLLEHAPFLNGLAASIASAWHAQPVYWGSWLGLLLAGAEWLLNPFVRRDLRTPGRLEGALRTAGLTIATTGLFALTHNLWLCLGCSVIVETVVAGWFPVAPTETPVDLLGH